MSFDPRSLERLRELGRSLPKPLPAPEARPAAPPERRPRHRVETETDPETLFRELMQASSDGTVPPHLMDRLRQLESERQSRRQAISRQPIATPDRAAEAGGRGGTAAAKGKPGAQGGGRASGKGAAAAGNLGRRDPRLADAHGDLYTAFQQLLLEGEGEGEETE